MQLRPSIITIAMVIADFVTALVVVVEVFVGLRVTLQRFTIIASGVIVGASVPRRGSFKALTSCLTFVAFMSSGGSFE